MIPGVQTLETFGDWFAARMERLGRRTWSSSLYWRVWGDCQGAPTHIPDLPVICREYPIQEAESLPSPSALE